MRMDKALMLLLGLMGAAFVLIPDQKQSADPAAAPAKAPAPPPVATPAEPAFAPSPVESEGQSYEAKTDYSDSSSAPFAVGEPVAKTSPSFEQSRAKALNDEAAYQALHRGN